MAGRTVVNTGRWRLPPDKGERLTTFHVARHQRVCAGRCLHISMMCNRTLIAERRAMHVLSRLPQPCDIGHCEGRLRAKERDAVCT